MSDNKSYAERLAAWVRGKFKRESRPPMKRGDRMSWVLTIIFFVALFIPTLAVMDAYGYEHHDPIDKIVWWCISLWLQGFIATGLGHYITVAKIRRELGL